MNITQTITLDLAQVGVFTAVNAKQGDDQTRFVRAVILDGGMVWQAPEGTTAGFRCVKPDGHSCQNPAVINADGTVTVELTAQVLAVPGTVWADICFINAAGEVLSTASFSIYVAGVPQGQNIPSSNEFLTLVDMVTRGEAVLAELGQAEGGLADLRQRVTDLENAPDEGGVSSWEELTDKPFTEVTNETDILPEMAFTSNLTDMGYGLVQPSPTFSLTTGESYLVSWDGEIYPVTAIDATIPGIGTFVSVGNGSAMGYPGNGEPFAICVSSNYALFFALTDTDVTDHSVRIYQAGKSVWKLDEKCLPMSAIEAKIEEVISAALEGDY